MPENPERYSQEESLSEAFRIREQVDSGEASSYTDAEKNLIDSIEQKISPELKASVIKKINDLDKAGVAYHVTQDSPDTPKLISMLETGLVTGMVSHIAKTYYAEEDRASLPKRVREVAAHEIKYGKNPNSHLWFNIVGRARDTKSEPDATTEIEQMGLYNWEGQVAVLFNISDFTEVEKPDKSYFEKRKHFSYNHDIKRSETEPNKALSSLGFMINDRISPRRFQGIVLRTHTKANYPEHEHAGTIWPKKLKEVVATMLDINKDHPERIVPIYDEMGNLLWPEKLSRDQINELVLQRTEKNSDTKDIV